MGCQKYTNRLLRLCLLICESTFDHLCSEERKPVGRLRWNEKDMVD